MNELRVQIVNALLVVLTVAAVIAAAVNFQQQQLVHMPDDGVVWIDRSVGSASSPTGPSFVEARHVEPGGPGDRAGIKPGDVLEKIRSVGISKSIDVAQVLWTTGAWNKVDYLLLRRGIEIKATVIPIARTPGTVVYYQYLVGLAYLLIGLFIFFRRGNAPKARHFFLLCLWSFVLCTFHYTGKLNTFDKVIYWGNVVATFLAPSLFLHFCLTFPESGKWWRGGRPAWLYVPALLMVWVTFGVATGMIQIAMPLDELRWHLDRAGMLYLALAYLSGGLALALRHRSVEDSVLRQQMKWVRNGAILGVLPFTLMYVIPYTMGAVPETWMRLSVFSLALIPLTWAYAIARYRLMDVDVIFQQGYVYTLATLSVLGIFYGLVFSVTKFGKVEELSPSGFGVLIIIATFVFQPIRNWIQENLDRYFFYKESYNYRRTLIEFARELSSETDLDRMLASISDRLLRTLSIQHLAFFLSREDDAENFELRHVAGVRPLALPEYRDLAFLSSKPDKPYLFFERTRATLPMMIGSWPPAVRQTIAELDLTYYLPCSVRGQTIAYLGVSRTAEGDFLTSDDVELLQTLANYVGIAIENARLYHSLQRKVDEYERLKEFNENIVESINVGILAADLEDRVSSWNNEIERLTGVTRAAALGRKLAELLPAELSDRLSALRGESGIHHIDKLRLRLAHKAANGNGRNGHSSGVAMREAIVNVAIAPLVSRDQEQIGRLIILDDITDRSELERQLVQADKLSSIGLLAAGVAHEVNTPLAVISTYAQMLAKQVNGDDQKAALLDKIAKQTFRASEIVNSLLNFSRTSTTEYTELEVNRMIRDTVSLVEHQLKKAQVQVDLSLAEQVPLMRGNGGKLQQVLLNLLINSRDALEEVNRGEGRRISIRSYAAADRVFIEVSDNGQGIAAEALPRIFDPFFTTKGARKGTGLGLSVSYGIVQEHGGTIRVESLPGSGTRFRLEFPLSRKLQHA